MPTININNNTVVVQTAAQWAADTTVYTNKQILITSDAFWGSTDQRKFKIADGVQTWSNLDYPPFETATDTLSEVLAAGSTTGGQAITGDSTELFLIVNDAIALLGYDAGAGVTANVSASSTHAQIDYAGVTYSGFVEVQDTKTEVQHDNLIELDAPSVRLIQETASRVAILDASKDIVGADTATYPSLTELSYVKGVTSAIQTQLDGKLSTTTPKLIVSQDFGAVLSSSPVDGSVLYLSFPINQAPNATATNRKCKLPTGVIRSGNIGINVNNVLGSSETITFNLRDITNSTSTLLGTGTADATSNSFLISGLNISVSSSNNYCIEVSAPTWATNPTNVQYYITLNIFDQ